MIVGIQSLASGSELLGSHPIFYWMVQANAYILAFDFPTLRYGPGVAAR
jgi:hypothetical protein